MTIAGFRLCTWLFRIGSAGNSGSSFSPGGHWRPLAATGGHCRPLVLHQGICGKLIVATLEAQLPELKALEMKALSSAHGEIGEGTTTPQSQGIYCSKR